MIHIIKPALTRKQLTALLYFKVYFLLLTIITTLLLTLLSIFTISTVFMFYFYFCWGTWLFKIVSGVCKKCGSRVVTPLP